MHDPRLALAIDLIERTRQYTLMVVDHVDLDRWFEMPPGQVTHVGWQVGHLLLSHHGHVICQLVGPTERNDLVEPSSYAKLFGKGSTPVANPTEYPAATELRDRLARQLNVSLDVLRQFDPARLDEPPTRPHWACNSKLDSLTWAVRHEMLHTGQIGLCRRLLGELPYR